MSNNEKHKVSIITFWGVPNYGAFAQAYALNRKIKELFPDYTVEHIAYLKKKHYDSYYSRVKPEFPSKSNLNGKSYIYGFARYCKRLLKYYLVKPSDYTLFKKTWNKIHHITIDTEEDLENSEWDYIVTGSDCIWQFSTEDFGCDAHLIGDQLKCNKLVAYACSYGDQKGPLPEFVTHQLKKYFAISVRDKFSQDVTESLLNNGQKIPLVLDPTLIYDFSKDENIIYDTRKNYIFVYGLGFPKDTQKEVLKYAREHNLKTVGIGHAPKWCDIRIREIDPFVWMGTFRNADFVVTDTFHGLMFCLINKKKFYFYQQPYVKNRSTTILELTGLDKLFLNREFSLDKMLMYDWNYEKIDAKLAKYKNQSVEFLKNALK